MKRILVIAGDLNPNDLGGAELHVLEVSKRLARHYELTLLVGPSLKISSLLPRSITVLAVNYPKIPNLYSPAYVLVSIFRSMQLNRKVPFNLIWAKQEFPYAIAGAVVSWLTGIPLYVTAQNPRSYVEEMVISAKFVPIRSVFHYFSERALSWALRQAAVTAAVSNYSAMLARRMGAKRVLVIPNGVNSSSFRVAPVLKKREKVIITTTSTLIPRNGIDTALAAVSQLPANLDWEFKIAGDGPEKLRLQASAKSLGISHRVKFLGTLTQAKVKQLLTKSHIFIRPSRFEGFGVSFLEAMASGIPVITTHSGGQKDFVIPNKTGLVVEVDDSAGLARAIIKLVTQPKLAQAVRDRALEMIEEKYDWGKIALQVENVFKQIS